MVKSKGTAIAIVILLLVGCSNSLDSQTFRLATFIKYNQMGSSRDYWLVKHNLLGDLEKVSLIFGFADDREFCEEVASLYMKKYPASRYLCTAAN
jgi:uncharacterized lipoprotein NlpE involved in copper resistance